MGKPIISVVIPCYNASAWLGDCLRSVWAQKVHFEVIVVDDGSTDDTFERAKELTRDYAAMSMVIYQRNQGAGAARNAGLRLAQGSYVCFLDADDEYLPGYFASAIQILESRHNLIAVDCHIELVDPHRPVEPWQIETIEGAIPGNLIIRTEVARRVGGFPVAAAFRGRAAGEDCAFRQQLRRFGNCGRVENKYYKYRVRPGSHFDFFADRYTVQNGKSKVSVHSQEEMDGSFAKAVQRYEDDVRDRGVALLVKDFQAAMTTTADFHALQKQIAPIEGFLSSVEGFALHQLARSWSAEGRVVEIGSSNGQSTCWLARGCKEGQNGKVAAINCFEYSPEMKTGGPPTVADNAAGPGVAVLNDNLSKTGLSDWVEVFADPSLNVNSAWREPIRLLFMNADHTYELMAEAFLSWSKYLTRNALIVFRNVGVSPCTTRFYNQLRANTRHWKEMAPVQSLGILQSITE